MIITEEAGDRIWWDWFNLYTPTRCLFNDHVNIEGEDGKDIKKKLDWFTRNWLVDNNKKKSDVTINYYRKEIK